MGLEQTKQVKIGPDYYNMTSDDDYLDYVAADFEPSMVEFYQSLLRPDGCVLDIGANIGCTALLFSKNASLVHAFEPSPSTFSYLDRNIKQSKLKNIITYNIGFGKEKKICNLEFSPNNRSGGFVSDMNISHKAQQKEQIILETLDEFIPSQGLKNIDFMKIDAEGYEKNILIGGEKIIKKYEPVVMLELNHWCLNAFQRISVPDFFDYLKSLFPHLYAFDDKTKQIANLRDSSKEYEVMYHHIIHFNWMNIVGSFRKEQLHFFLQKYQ